MGWLFEKTQPFIYSSHDLVRKHLSEHVASKVDEINQRPKTSALTIYAVYLFNYTRIAFIFLTKIAIDFTCYAYFSRFQPRQ